MRFDFDDSTLADGRNLLSKWKVLRKTGAVSETKEINLEEAFRSEMLHATQVDPLLNE